MEKRLQDPRNSKTIWCRRSDAIDRKRKIRFSDQMEKYLDSFDGYLYVGNESSYCPIRAGMELLGKDIFVMEDGIIKKDEKKQFKDERSFEEFRMKKWDDFL